MQAPFLGISFLILFLLVPLLPPLLHLYAPVLVILPVVLLTFLAAVLGSHAVFAHEILRGVAVPTEFCSV